MMHMQTICRHLRFTPVWLLAALALSACDGGSVANTLGMNIEAPDEFTVVSRPPLSLPPEFNLRRLGALVGWGGAICVSRPFAVRISNRD